MNVVARNGKLTKKSASNNQLRNSPLHEEAQSCYTSIIYPTSVRRCELTEKSGVLALKAKNCMGTSIFNYWCNKDIPSNPGGCYACKLDTSLQASDMDLTFLAQATMI